MVKHLVMFSLKEELTEAEKTRVKQEIKEGLEGLKGKIDGLIEIKVCIDGLYGSNMDIYLEAVLENKEALDAYIAHKEHVAVGMEKVNPFKKDRVCFDFEM